MDFFKLSIYSLSKSQNAEISHQKKHVFWKYCLNSILFSTTHYFATFHQQLLLIAGYKRNCHNTALLQMILDVFDIFWYPEVHDFPVTCNITTEWCVIYPVYMGDDVVTSLWQSKTSWIKLILFILLQRNNWKIIHNIN